MNQKKLLILGATGGTGQQVLIQALEAGDQSQACMLNGNPGWAWDASLDKVGRLERHPSAEGTDDSVLAPYCVGEH